MCQRLRRRVIPSTVTLQASAARKGFGTAFWISSLCFFIFIFVVTNSQAQAGGDFVGRKVCAECHAEQVERWRGSHHDLAMQHATDETVLGDFSSAEFSYAGVKSKFYRTNNRFMVRTDGPDGELNDYQIKYTFGVAPLQQYLVELDVGRLQALSIAWDARPKDEGGQRWFHLHPDEGITHKDELHWTRSNFNWNGMCAECHSTNLRKHYDSTADTFETVWSEIDVSCEACHGPASWHVAWARKETGWEALANKGLSILFDTVLLRLCKKNIRVDDLKINISLDSPVAL